MSTVTDLESYQQYAQEQQAANNAWSAEQAQKQMDFQERMSNSAHQREVADLKAAGLNPVLSANSGASVPNGAAAEGDKSTAANVGAILQQVLQAQSAREVAGMYNAATIAAATIAANASMYGSDMSYANTEDHPKTVEEMAARAILAAEGGGNSRPGSGSGSGSGSNSAGSLSSVFSNPDLSPFQKIAKAIFPMAQVSSSKSFSVPQSWTEAVRKGAVSNKFNQFEYQRKLSEQWRTQVLPRLKGYGLEYNKKLQAAAFDIWRTKGSIGLTTWLRKLRYKPNSVDLSRY